MNELPGRVASGQPNSYRGQKTKKIRHFRHATITAVTAMVMAAAIPNPPRHHYSVAFFQKTATKIRHGRHLTTLGTGSRNKFQGIIDFLESNIPMFSLIFIPMIRDGYLTWVCK